MCIVWVYTVRYRVLGYIIVNFLAHSPASYANSLCLHSLTVVWFISIFTVQVLWRFVGLLVLQLVYSTLWQSSFFKVNHENKNIGSGCDSLLAKYKVNFVNKLVCWMCSFHFIFLLNIWCNCNFCWIVFMVLICFLSECVISKYMLW